MYVTGIGVKSLRGDGRCIKFKSLTVMPSHLGLMVVAHIQVTGVEVTSLRGDGCCVHFRSLTLRSRYLGGDGYSVHFRSLVFTLE